MAKKDKHSDKSEKEEIRKDKPEQQEDVEAAEMSSQAEEKEEEEKKKSKNKKQNKQEAELDKKDQIIEELNEKYKLMNDKYLRLSAEFDNFRKRTLKEKMDMTKTAGSDIISGLLPVIDDMERAMQIIEEAEDLEAVKKGMELIHNKFENFLKQKGVTPIEAEGKTFDTDEHEAMTKIPAPNKELKGKVVDVIQKGYKLNDEVLRYSKVVVGE
ncbi:MAG: nucleotide exchange factor GrpE [Bacteroidota bacterium]